MLSKDAEQPELENFVLRFLYRFYPIQAKRDYDIYFGELISTCYDAKTHYIPEKSTAKFNTYLTKSLFNKMTAVNKQEKDWYSHHVSMDLSSFKANDLPSVKIAEHREMVEIIQQSEFPEKTKEILISFVTKPYQTYEELGKEFGVSKQRIGIIIMTARQTLARRGIEID